MTPPDGKPRAWTVLLIGLSAWLCVWIVLAWHAVQDDAFIHLRYADHLLRFHRITYDGVHPDFGASSLLYVALLAGMRWFTTSPELPHAFSVLEHVLLFATVALVFVRFVPVEAKRARALAVLTLILMVTPAAVRWFEDGMETGLTTWFAVLLSVAAHRFSRTTRFPSSHAAALFLLGFFIVIHRVELAMPVAIACFIFLFAPVSERPFPQRLLRPLPLMLGAALSMLFIIHTMHALLPDTAIAKSGVPRHWPGTLENLAVVLVGGGTIGLGLAIVWLLTLFVLLRATRVTLATALANTVFPITFLLIGIRGQELQGARYLIWTFAFSILWNVLELARVEAQPAPALATERLSRVLTRVVLTVLCLSIPYESYLMLHILRLRSQTEVAFRSQSLPQMRGLHGVAYDVGYIGYFSQAELCDLAGLVNGRDKARLNNDLRLKRCAASHPDFLFTDIGQTYTLATLKSLKGWNICATYDLINVRSVSQHFLLASPAATAQVCAAAGNPVLPVPADMMPVLRTDDRDPTTLQ